jgi:tRNA/rRNA methyltransferase
MVSTIPTALRQPAINLAQSVMVYCYELYKSFTEEQGTEVFSWDLAPNRDIYQMYEHMDACLQSIHFHPRVDIKDFIDRFRRVLGRIALEKRDVKLFHKLFAEVERAIKEAEKKRDGI